MTTATTIGAIFMTPFLCKTFLGTVVPVDARGIVVSTLQVVLAPIVLGMTLNAKAPKPLPGDARTATAPRFFLPETGSPSRGRSATRATARPPAKHAWPGARNTAHTWFGAQQTLARDGDELERRRAAMYKETFSTEEKQHSNAEEVSSTSLAS